MKSITCLVWLLPVALVNHSFCASVVQYQNKPAWQAATGFFTTIPFTGFPTNTNITSQYSTLGITFTDGQDLILPDPGFLNDGWGLNGAFDSITVAFDQPMTAIAVEFPGTVQIRLFQQGNLIYESSLLGQVQVGNFGGLVSSTPFDSAQIFDPLLGVFIDDLHFGPPIPAPGAIALLGIASLLASSSRRRRC